MLERLLIVLGTGSLIVILSVIATIIIGGIFAFFLSGRISRTEKEDQSDPR